MRIILYTGKGGVGKTSIAAATSCKIASEGKRVLIMSTDQAHSLGDAFEMKLSNDPTFIKDNLYAMEIDVLAESERAWGSMKEYMKKLITSRSEDGIEAEELLAFPGFEELFSLLKIMDIYEKNQYDILIVDCAPTGETMSLLKFPEMVGSWMSKVLPMKRKAVKVVGPAVEKIAKIPMPKDIIFDEIEHLLEKLEKLQKLMSQKEIVSIRIVTTPEKIVVQESKRNFSFLHLYDYNVDAIIVNRIYPIEAMQGYFSKWMKRQEDSLKDIEESFVGIPIFRLPLLGKELKNLKLLEEAATIIYGESDPTQVLFNDTIFKVDKNEKGYTMRIFIPFVDKKEMDLLQKGDELTLSIKNERRNFILPELLKNQEISGAEYKDDALYIHFA